MLTPCPRCSAGLTGGPTCTACGLPLTGPAALALWQVDQEIAQVDGRISALRGERRGLWSEHVRLVAELSESTPVPIRPYAAGDPLPPVPVPPLPPFPTVPRWAVDTTRQTWTPPAPGPVRPKQEWTPRRVQNLLLSIGALLLVIAGAIFTAVSWRHLGAAVRGAILLSLTAAAAMGCRTLARRGLTATAEAISAVCLGLGFFDAYALQASALPDVAGYAYWAGATAVLAGGAAGLGRLTKVRLPWVAAASLALLPLLILCTADLSQAGRAVLVSLDALAAAGGLAGLRQTGSAGRSLADVRTCWQIGAGLLWVIGFALSATPVVYGLRGQSPWTLLLALGLTSSAAAVAAWAAGDRKLPNGASALTVLSGASALSAIVLLALPFTTQLASATARDAGWRALVLVVAALAVLMASIALPALWRLGPAVTAVAAAGLAGSTALPSIASTLVGQLSWVNQPWSIGSSVLGRDNTLATPQQLAGAVNLLTLTACAVVAVVAGMLLNRRGAGLAVGAGLSTIIGLVTVAQLGGSYAVGWCTVVGVAVVATTCAVLAERRSSALAAHGAGLATAASVVVAVGWSLAVPGATACVAAALAVVLAVAATVGVPYRPVWAGGAVLSAGLAAAAISHVAGAPDAAVGLVVAGVPIAVTAGLAVAQKWFHLASSASWNSLEAAGAALAATGLAVAGQDAGWFSCTLLAVAAAALLSTVRPERREAAPVSIAIGLLAVTVAPFAQQLPASAIVATCIGLTGLSLAGACAIPETSALRRQIAAVLAAGSLAQAASAVIEASRSDRGLTVCLVLLCVMYGCAAGLPDSQLAKVGRTVRAASAGVSAALLLGAVASGCVDGAVQPAVVGLVVALVAAALATAATQLSSRQPDSMVVEVVSALAVVPALMACADRPTFAGWVLAVAGLTVLVSATRPDRRSWWPAGAALISSATWVWLWVAGVTAPEPYTDPIAALALYLGYARRRTVPQTASLTAYGPGLSGLLLPSLAYALLGSGIERPMLLAALAAAVVVVGAQHRLRAPLLFGSATLVITALRLLVPYAQLVPRWLEIGTVGAVLLTLGATYEQRRRDLGSLRARYDALL